LKKFEQDRLDALEVTSGFLAAASMSRGCLQKLLLVILVIFGARQLLEPSEVSAASASHFSSLALCSAF